MSDVDQPAAVSINIGDDDGVATPFNDFQPMPDSTQAELPLGDVDSSDASHPSAVTSRRSAATSTGPSDEQPLPTTDVSRLVWAAGKQQVESAFNLYANIDILRPYFDVTPEQVRLRLLYSFVPRMSLSKPREVPSELYGPVMIVFTLVAILLYTMKSADHTVRDGTLIGSALFVCFGYWFLITALVSVISYIYNGTLNILQIMSTMGYGVSSHCVVTLISDLLHNVHSTHGTAFYLTSITLTALTALTMCSEVVSHMYMSQTHQKLLVSLTIISIHLTYMFYLHFAYHRTIQAVSDLTAGG